MATNHYQAPIPAEPPIGIAMSGGVDSTVAAILLSRNHQVCGFLMDLGQPDFSVQYEKVARIAEQIGIELKTCDVRQPFNARVIDYFSGAYAAGLTPNPCIICNQQIKFGLLLKQVTQAGFPVLATGHYCRINGSGAIPHLLRGFDPAKDQSYFLSRLRPEVLNRVRFPLGSMLKTDVYRLAKDYGFDDFIGRESQDVCFMQARSVPEFLASLGQTTGQQGPIVTTDGARIGTHNGVFHYTVGQRRGINLPYREPLYVTAIRAGDNTLVVGTADDLVQKTLYAQKANWLSETLPRTGDRFLAQIRSTHRAATATIISADDDAFSIRFNEPQRAIAPGQFAVLYSDDRVMGSGEITLAPRISERR